MTWNRRLNRPGAEQRTNALRGRFRRLGRRRVPRSLAVMFIGLVVIATLALVQSLQNSQQNALALEAPRAGPARTTPYRNCDEARADGAAPIMRGQPGYGEHLDRDGDGWACEPYYGR